MPNALVIGDSRAIRRILGRALEQFGYTVFPVGNGREAMDKVKKDSPDLALVLVDWHMPEMNGLEFVHAFRRPHRYQRVPLVMVTTETETDQMMEALSAGANECVMKPFTEIANMIGGNLKSLLPPGCSLSLPAVNDGPGPDLWPGAQAKITCSFDGPEGPFLVTLFAIEPDGCSRFPQ